MSVTRLAVLTATAAALVQCAAAPAPVPKPAEPTSSTTTTERTTVPPSPAQPEPASVHPVSAAELGATWHPGCPVAPEALRRVELDYWGFDEQSHRGELVVHRDLATDIIAVFDELFRIRFPIERMRSVDHYRGADDELSMRDNNTSAFNCRDIPGTGRWSLHADGTAVDVNPRLNLDPWTDCRLIGVLK